MMINIKNTSRMLYIFLLPIVFILSFRSFAAVLYPDLNSDHAIHVLMAYDLKLPDDLYYWGQDRLGSLIPIIGHIILKLFPLSPIEVISLVQYLIIAVGFLSFAALFKSIKSKIIFAIAWFLPLKCFSELIQPTHPYAPQFTFIAIAIVAINRLAQINPKTDQMKGEERTTSMPASSLSPLPFTHLHLIKSTGLKEVLGEAKRQVLIFISVASLFVSLWISELSLVTIFILCFIALKSRLKVSFKETSLLKIKEITFKIDYSIFTVLFTSLIGISFLLYAKQHALPVGVYHQQVFNNFSQTLEVIDKLTNSFVRSIIFRADNIFFSLPSILVLLLIVSLLYILYKKKPSNRIDSQWMYLFFWNAILSFVLLIFSHWVYINESHLRYFTVVYVSCWVAALLFAETLTGITKKRIYAILALIAISSSFSLPSYVFSINKPESKIDKAQELQTLGKVSFIGDYWTSYLICSVNPSLFDCTPHEKSAIRCSRCIPRVLAAPTIYLVKEQWLDSFPSHIDQFGVTLKKLGEERKIGGYTIAPYKAMDNKDKVFSQDIRVLEFPKIVKPDSTLKIIVLIKNTSNFIWSPKGDTPTHFGYLWLDTSGNKELFSGLGSQLPDDLAPGESLGLNVVIKTPSTRGKYKLILTMVQHKVTWFKDKTENYPQISLDVT
jgi:hypothetical protein